MLRAPQRVRGLGALAGSTGAARPSRLLNLGFSELSSFKASVTWGFLSLGEMEPLPTEAGIWMGTLRFSPPQSGFQFC